MKGRKSKKSKILIVAIVTILIIVSTIITIVLTPKSYALTTEDGKFDYFYNPDDMTAIISKCNNIGDGDGNVVVPSTIGDYQVTTVLAEVFTGSWIKTIYIPSSVVSISGDVVDDCSNLTSITVDEQNTNYSTSEGVLFNKEKTTILCYPQGKQETEYEIPDSVTDVYADTFDKCENLISIDIPNTVTSIGSRAFNDCSKLENMELPSGLKTIEENLFDGCTALKSVSIPEGITSIGARAFRHCSNLSTITIPAKVTSIGESALYGCNALKSIEVDENNTKYMSENGVLFNKSKTEIIQYPAKKEETIYTIPEQVTSVGEYAFYYCENLTNITIQEGIIDIGRAAFSFCRSLDNIVIPKSVKTIGSHAFRYCTNLRSITIDGEITEISGSCFYGCSSLESIVIPYGVTKIDYEAFIGCTSLKSITMPRTVRTINSTGGNDDLTIYGWAGSYAQEYANEKSITFIELIDTVSPTIFSVRGNATNWTNKDVTLTISAIDKESGLAGYSFDNGETWQTSRMKTYSKNTSGVIIKVKDNQGNIATYEETINIDKIDTMAPIAGTLLMKLNNESGTDYTNDTWTEQSVYIAINNGSDELSGHKTTTYSVNSGAATVNPQTLTESGTYEIVVTTTDNAGNTATNSYTIKIRKAECIEITAKPSKMEYEANENFNSDGMEISVTYDNGGKEATCTETGLTEGKHCLNCGEILEEQEEIPAKGHSYEEIVTEPTCTEKGYTTHTCTGCKDSYVDTYTNELGHNYKDGQCIECGEKFSQIEVTSKKYKIDDIYISKIQEKVTVKELKEELETNATQINIYNKDNEQQEEETKLATGMKAELKLNDQVKTFTIVVSGDVDGDGEIKLADMSMVNRCRLKKTTLDGAYFIAADVTGDGVVNFQDLVKINRFRLHKITEL